MPKEKPINETNNKPLTPSLSSAFRSNKTQLTPKIVGSTPSIPPRSGRNVSHSDFNSSPSISTRDNTNHASPSLDANITPRSGARRTKLGGSPATAGGTPAGTPTNSRPVSMIEASTHGYARQPVYGTTGLGINSSNNIATNQPRPTSIVGSPSIPTIPSRRTSIGSNSHFGNAAPSKFFHADDAQSAVSAASASVDEKPKLTNKAATFFHANSPFTTTTKSSLPRSTPSPVLQRGVAINSTPAVPRIDSKAAVTTKSAERRSPSPRLLSPPLAPQRKPLPRPPSPLKSVSFESAPAIPSSNHQNMRRNAGGVVSASPAVHLRKSSLGSNASNTPSGRQYTPTINSGTYPRTRTPSLSSNSSPLSAKPPTNVTKLPLTGSPDTSPRTASFGSSIGMHSSGTDPLMSPQLTPASPTTRGDLHAQPQTQLQRMNELAANARRERKVLDLEISNSSLLAINRTLERELRKQAAELRRFRRLSRSGRLSLAERSRASSLQDDLRNNFSHADDDDDISHLDSITESLSDSDNDSDSLRSSISPSESTSDLSHSQQSSSSRRTRDEKRLLLDLSKHRQLLVDSQKMSQSIKRCLTWTEELIADGQKALQYQVRVSDVELGGRVLVREDGEEVPEEAPTTLLGPAVPVGTGEAGERKFWELSEALEGSGEEGEALPLAVDFDSSGMVS